MTGIIYQYKLNEKLYVGKTLMQERKRRNKHKFEALTKKAETPFARAIRKYGWDKALTGYSVIETIECDSKQELNLKLHHREEYWITKLNTLVPNGYNCYSNGQVGLPSYNDKAAMYEKISKSLKGKHINSESQSKKVFCFEQGEWYLSVRDAERKNGIARGSINKAVQGKNCKAGGLTWGFSETPTFREDQIKAKRKPIICIETGITYESIYEASKLFLPDEPSKNTKPKIQMSIKHGWAVSGYHFEHLDT